MLSLPIAFTSAIGVFAPVFSRPVWQHVKVLLTGAVLAPGKRTVTAILQIMGRNVGSDFQTSHRVLHRAVWSPLTASRLLLRFVVAVFIPSGVVVFGLDDMLIRSGISGFRAGTLAPQQTIETLKEDAQWLRTQAK